MYKYILVDVLGDLDTRFSIGQEVKFQRFIYFDSELFQVKNF